MRVSWYPVGDPWMKWGGFAKGDFDINGDMIRREVVERVVFIMGGDIGVNNEAGGEVGSNVIYTRERELVTFFFKMRVFCSFKNYKVIKVLLPIFFEALLAIVVGSKVNLLGMFAL